MQYTGTDYPRWNHYHAALGFIKGRTCVTQLLTMLDYWTETLDKAWKIGTPEASIFSCRASVEMKFRQMCVRMPDEIFFQFSCLWASRLECTCPTNVFTCPTNFHLIQNYCLFLNLIYFTCLHINMYLQKNWQIEKCFIRNGYSVKPNAALLSYP